MTNATDFIVSLIRKDAPRLLKLYFPHDDGPSSGLLVNHLVAEESLSCDFTFTVTVLSDDPNIDLSEVQGRMVCVEVLREVGQSRYFNGYCFEFSLKRVDNGLAIYEMVLKPWLAQFRLRHNYHLFHNLNITEQTKQLFCETGLSSHEFRMNQSDPARTFSCQYDETDYNYLHRRWEEMGWHYWYEHTLSGHKLILSDTSQDADAIDGKPLLAYHHDGGSNKDDKIANWSPGSKIVSGQVTLGSFDFKRPSPQSAGVTSSTEQGDIHQFEVYQYEGLYGFRHAGHGSDIARLRMDAIDVPGKQFQANGNSRAVQPGRWFGLNKDFAGQMFDAKDADVEFFVVSARHEVDNNYLNASGAHASYENEFTCVPRSVAWRPAIGRNSTAVKVSGVDTAIVVGSGGQDIYTDEFGRIRVQFHWDRKGSNDAGSSAWVRVASNWAGAELGAMALPRIGSEVIVQWLSGNPDRPIVMGSVYNARKMPPWQLPSQQALSGLRSRELTPGGGNAALGRSNHLILDDTHEKIQAQLKSDHQSSQLSLGHITRIDSNAGRKDYRGEGWELTTNAWGVARAAKGLLITTEPRLNAAAHTKDMGETIARLDHARELHQQQAQYAQELGVQEAKIHQAAVAQTLAGQHDAIKGSGGTFPELTGAHLVLASPAGIETTTQKSTHISSDDHTAITTGKSLSIASGDSFFATIRKTFRLLVQKAGMKLVAAGGDIDMQALEQSIHVLAKLNITHTANRITLTAKEEIVINGGGSYIKYSAKGIEQGTSGSHVSHAATHSFVGPNSIPVTIPPPPVANIPDEFSNRLDVHDLFLKHEFEDISFAAKFADGRALTGKLDEHGRSSQIYGKEEGKLDVLVGKSHDEWDLIVDYAEAAAADAGEAATETVSAAVGEAVSTQSTAPLKGLQERAKDNAITHALRSIDPAIASAVGTAIRRHDMAPLKALAQGFEGKIIAQVLTGLDRDVADAVGKSIAADNGDPIKAMVAGIGHKVIGEVADIINDMSGDA